MQVFTQGGKIRLVCCKCYIKFEVQISDKERVNRCELWISWFDRLQFMHQACKAVALTFHWLDKCCGFERINKTLKLLMNIRRTISVLQLSVLRSECCFKHMISNYHCCRDKCLSRHTHWNSYTACVGFLWAINWTIASHYEQKFLLM